MTHFRVLPWPNLDNRDLEGASGVADQANPRNALVQPGRNNIPFRLGVVSAHRSI